MYGARATLKVFSFCFWALGYGEHLVVHRLLKITTEKVKTFLFVSFIGTSKFRAVDLFSLARLKTTRNESLVLVSNGVMIPLILNLMPGSSRVRSCPVLVILRSVLCIQLRSFLRLDRSPGKCLARRAVLITSLQLRPQIQCKSEVNENISSSIGAERSRGQGFQETRLF